MSNTSLQHSGSRNHAPLNFICWLALVALLASLVPSRADEKEDEYLRIYDLVQSADTLNNAGKFSPALAKYREAQTALLAFKRNYPEWNPASVSYRLNYLAVKIAEISDKISNSSATPSKSSQGQGQSKSAPESSAPEIKLLEAGAEPRKVLRLHPKAGDKQAMELSIQPTIEGRVGDMANSSMRRPGMKMVMGLTVKDISSDGDIDYQIVITDVAAIAGPTGDAQTAQAINSAAGELKGAADAGTISNRGVERGTQFEMPADAGEAFGQLLETFSNLTIPLPEEAVGAGAKWEARSQVKSRGMTEQQTTTYELASLDGERATIKISSAQHAANQKIQNPVMPGTQANVTKMDVKGTGNVNLLLTEVLPSSGRMDFHSEIDMVMNMGPQKQPMSIKSDVSVTLESK
jgi:Family of unknown function (DUF6263)